MRSRRRALLCLVAICLVFTAPLIVSAFDLIELLIEVALEPGEDYSDSFDQQQFPNTGFTIANPSQDSAILVNGASAFLDAGLLTGEVAQDGFILLDGTLLLQVEATDPQGARAITRTTYRFDLRRAFLRRAFIRDTLIRQGVVSDEGRARARARYMSLADARVMRYADVRQGEARWVRAVRAIRDLGRADIRFTPRMEPDGQLGHFGTAVSADGDSYVWAVMDRNSRYAVGLTIDRDNDGVPNSDDNCIGDVNSNQADLDGDGFGDECDLDDDADGVLDVADNCPLAANAGQEDLDGDGFGDACDLDADGDGVIDGDDQCLETAAGEIVDPEGCSIGDRCPCESGWKNHGAYVRCVARTAEVFVDFGLITEAEKDAIVSTGAQSDCG